MTPGELIKKAMVSKGIGVAHLCMYSKIQKFLIYNIIKDERSISVHNAIKIANVLKNITANQILHLQVDFLVDKEYSKTKTLIKPHKLVNFENRKAS